MTYRMPHSGVRLNEQVAYKRWPGHKNDDGNNYFQHGRLAKAEVTTCVLDTGT